MAPNNQSSRVVGEGTTTNGSPSHVEGFNITAKVSSGPLAHEEGYGTTASGGASHAEGIFTTSSGIASHAEGSGSKAIGRSSHAEGGPGFLKNGKGIQSTAQGEYAHAEGGGGQASGDTSHAEGNLTISGGNMSHAEGNLSTASGNAAHAEGKRTAASGLASHAEGESTDAIGEVSHAEGRDTIAFMDAAHAEGERTTASGLASHAEGERTTAIGYFSHVEGFQTKSKGKAAHAEGEGTIAESNSSHAEGKGTKASSLYSHAEGFSTLSSGLASHAEGWHTTANRLASHAEGMDTASNLPGSHIMGRFGVTTDNYSWHLANGTSLTNLSLAAKILNNGRGIADNGWIAGNADYAEMFETVDRKPIGFGYFVTLEGKKIRKVKTTDEYILGIVTANPAFLADSGELRWKGKYVTDEWGRVQYHNVVIPVEKDKDGNVIIPERTEKQPILNPDWDHTREYIPRSNRSEWEKVGLFGKLRVRDDGRCQVNGYCKPNADGIATDSHKGYRVMERIGPNQILILFR
ncbi:peptidase G2 autoproteolytic cleavage domain-containing protein [Bacillus clarus]|nr:peptidase G2 autoproteolytic cleavage domain-containing protein [Bacillus clarus]